MASELKITDMIAYVLAESDSNNFVGAHGLYTNVGAGGVHMPLALKGNDPATYAPALIQAKEILDSRTAIILNEHKNIIHSQGWEDCDMVDYIFNNKLFHIHILGRYFPIRQIVDGGGRPACLYHIYCTDRSIGVSALKSGLNTAYIDAFSAVEEPLDSRVLTLVQKFTDKLNTVGLQTGDKRIAQLINNITEQYALLAAQGDVRINNLNDAMLNCALALNRMSCKRSLSERDSLLLNKLMNNLENQQFDSRIM